MPLTWNENINTGDVIDSDNITELQNQINYFSSNRCTTVNVSEDISENNPYNSTNNTSEETGANNGNESTDNTAENGNHDSSDNRIFNSGVNTFVHSKIM